MHGLGRRHDLLVERSGDGRGGLRHEQVGDLAASMGIDWAAVEDAERELLARQLAGWSQKYPETFVEQRVTRDRPAHGLLEQAARAQLVVVGSRGRAEFAGLVLGSVGNAMVHRSPCPVAIVRPDTADHT